MWILNILIASSLFLSSIATTDEIIGSTDELPDAQLQSDMNETFMSINPPGPVPHVKPPIARHVEVFIPVPDVHATKSIVIIGAGVSGISCAYYLRKFGFRNVFILEAKDRVGGRMHTEYNCTLFEQEGQEDEFFIEIGCQWIHGQKGNAIYRLALENDLVDEDAPDYMAAFFNFGNRYGQEESEAIMSLINFLNERTHNASEYAEPDLSLGEFLDKEFNSYVMQQPRNMSDLLEGAFRYYSLGQCESNGCTDLSALSVSLLSQYHECEGNQNVELKRGYRRVLDLLLKDIPNDSIVLSKDVTTVDWSDFKKLELNNETETHEEKTCEYVYDNTTLEELRCECNHTECSLKVKVYTADDDVFWADHVVSTLSLGAMKRKYDSYFVPSLPEEKVAAIKAVGFGTINKIYFEFQEPFWEPATIYQVLLETSLYDFLREELHLPENTTNWIYFINRFAYVPRQPHMLCAWISDAGAVTMEEASEEEVINSSMVLLEKIVGRQLPRPQRMIRSRWNSDPQTFGSYSHLTVDSNEASHLDLAEPVFSDIVDSHKHPVLQFAGEATHPHFYSTVHGAFESGRREAQRLYDIYKRVM